ncbi:hypothetical protein [Shimia thalassica]|uniref:hypothetical protein n=1 Tax=Shimia thalassica TaxID=1715693 RepID=UPI0026E37949|nr:hypothetical protein [Shimia thalassica]MDO6483079.1 hypothetical protein [Shimia thalassica]
MNAKQQAEGERRVKDLLIDPLLRRGLVKPSNMRIDQFDAMTDDMCKRLAYMTALNLEALQEVAANMASGPAKDRFPIAQKVLKAAADLQPPSDGASALMRAVFAHEIGAEAIAEDWGPELLGHVRRTRQFPKAFSVSEIKARAADNARRVEKIGDQRRRGGEVSPQDEAFIAARDQALESCRRIRAVALQGAQG